jgi:hypothetical protein
LNEALLAKAAQARLLRTNRVRADTTVAPSNGPTLRTRVCWPRRSGASPNTFDYPSTAHPAIPRWWFPSPAVEGGRWVVRTRIREGGGLAPMDSGNHPLTPDGRPRS